MGGLKCTCQLLFVAVDTNSDFKQLSFHVQACRRQSPDSVNTTNTNPDFNPKQNQAKWTLKEGTKQKKKTKAK